MKSFLPRLAHCCPARLRLLGQRPAEHGSMAGALREQHPGPQRHQLRPGPPRVPHDGCRGGVPAPRQPSLSCGALALALSPACCLAGFRTAGLSGKPVQQSSLQGSVVVLAPGPACCLSPSAEPRIAQGTPVQQNLHPGSPASRAVWSGSLPGLPAVSLPWQSLGL